MPAKAVDGEVNLSRDHEGRGLRMDDLRVDIRAVTNEKSACLGGVRQLACPELCSRVDKLLSAVRGIRR